MQLRKLGVGLVLGLAAFSAAAVLILTYAATEVPNPNAEAYASFGYKVARVGDVNRDGVPDFVVGVPGYFYGQGRAYVMSGRDGAVIHTLDATNGGGSFGRAVAGIPDVDRDGIPDVMVGSREGWYEWEGKAYVFSGRSGVLIRVLDNPFPQWANEFGASLAAIGDLDGDGVPDLLVGTPGWHAPGPTLGPPCLGFPPNVRCWQGRVYAFSGRTGGLIRTIEHPSPRELTFFGYALTGAPDVNGDGIPDLVASAPLQTVGGLILTGEVYVISGRLGNLIRAIPSPKPQRNGNFGWSLDVRDNKGPPPTVDILVGAPGESLAAQRQGRAWLIRANDGVMRLSLDRPTALASARFGWDVAIAGNVDGDAVYDLLVGSPGEYPSPQGSAFLFNGATGALIRELKQPSPQPQSHFGYTVAGLGDANGDGRSDIAIGANSWHRSSALQQDGRAYLFKSFLREWPWWCFWPLPWCPS